MDAHLLRGLIENLPFAVELRDARGDSVLQNSARWALFGYSQEAFAQLDPGDYFEAEGLERFNELLGIRDSQWGIELAARHNDGSRLIIHIEVTPVDLEGESLQVLIMRDVTAQVTNRKNLENLRKRNQLILESAGEGIYGIDNQGRTTFVNPEAARMTGWEPEELLGRRNHDVVHHSRRDGSHYPREQCPIYAAFKDGLIHTVDDEVFWRKDGSSFPVEYTSNPIIGEDGDLLGAVVTFRDITVRKQNEKYLRRALEENRRLKEQLEDENVYLRQELKLTHQSGDIIGNSEALKQTLFTVDQVAATEATALVLGETGTGKELIAAAIHNRSRRSSRPLIKVNCAALPTSLIESELFGHEKGAFTGADKARLGRFEMAHGGSLFLDEIGELSMAMQAKLLRVLQEGEFERVGGAETIRVDVRIIAATNRDLVARVESGEFREDLFYRLNVVPIEIPPLRERPEDISQLAHAFARKFAQQVGKKVLRISPKSLDRMRLYSWPGNVRELQNVMERAVILSRGSTLEIEGLDTTEPLAQNAALTLRELERLHIIKVLDAHNWVIHGKGRAAETLDINPSTLRSRMKKLGIIKPRLHSGMDT